MEAHVFGVSFCLAEAEHSFLSNCFVCGLWTCEIGHWPSRQQASKKHLCSIPARCMLHVLFLEIGVLQWYWYIFTQTPNIGILASRGCSGILFEDFHVRLMYFLNKMNITVDLGALPWQDLIASLQARLAHVEKLNQHQVRGHRLPWNRKVKQRNLPSLPYIATWLFGKPRVSSNLDWTCPCSAYWRHYRGVRSEVLETDSGHARNHRSMTWADFPWSNKCSILAKICLYLSLAVLVICPIFNTK